MSEKEWKKSSEMWERQARRLLKERNEWEKIADGLHEELNRDGLEIYQCVMDYAELKKRRA